MKKKSNYFLIMLVLTLSAACLPTGTQTIVISEQNFFDLTPAATGSIAPYSKLVWAVDNRTITAVDMAGAQLLDANTLEAKESIQFSGDAYDYGASPDGKGASYSVEGQKVATLTFDGGEETIVVDTGGLIGGFDYSPDGNMILTISQEELAATIWDVQNGAEIIKLTGFMTAAPIYDAVFGPGGEHVVWISRGTLQISDVHSGFMSETFNHEDFVTAWALSHDGKYLASAAAGTLQGHFTPQVYVWDTASGEQRVLMSAENSFEALAFCPGTHLIAIAQGNLITIINLDAFEKTAELSFPGGVITALEFNPDGSALAAANADGMVKTWRIPAE